MESKQEKGVKAVNQEFKKYEQVEKTQNYHLSEIAGEEEFDETDERLKKAMQVALEAHAVSDADIAALIWDAIEARLKD